MSCSICCNDKLNQMATCKECQFETCIGCAQRYLLESTRDTADCMNCHVIWNREKLLEVFPKKWVKGEWKTRRQAMLFEKERGMMPATQLYINWLNNYDILYERRKVVVGEIARLSLSKVDSSELRALRYERRQLEAEIDRETNKDPTRPLDATRVSHPPQFDRVQLACPCPVQGCMGFVTKSSVWKCGICAVTVCKQCHELECDIEGRAHICKPENVLTAQAMAKESKPCPHCAVPTFRISGCSQMWCVICHKPWDWTTGLGVNEGEVIHNPHYFDWVRKNKELTGREEVGWLAADERWQYDPTTLPPLQLQLRASRSPEEIYQLTHLNRQLAHLWVEDRQNLTERNLNDNLDLRVRFMRRHITETQFMRLLYQREKKLAKSTEYAAVISDYYVAVVAVLKELCLNVMLNPRNTDLDMCFEIIESIRQQFEKRLSHVAAQYDAVAPKYLKQDYLE